MSNVCIVFTIATGIEWSDSAILLLTDSYDEFKCKFQDSELKKNNIWADLSTRMQRKVVEELSNGHILTGCMKCVVIGRHPLRYIQ
jgi:hypothetical protein